MENKEVIMFKAYAVLEEGGSCQPFDYEPGKLTSDHVDVEVMYSGLCHSDIALFDNEWKNSTYPVVGGHEVVGRVIATGPHVRSLKQGDVVGLGPHSGYCNTCRHCHQGEQNLCSEKENTVVGRYGGFADKVRAREASLIKIPAGMELEKVGPLLCAGITVFNPMVQFNIKPTDKVGVIGIGGLGHLAVQFLNSWGCDVTAFSASPEKMDEILNFGANRVINSRAPNEIKQMQGELDYIISTVTGNLDWGQYIAALAPKGRLHFVGLPEEPMNIHLASLILGQKSISGSPAGAPGTMLQMLNFAKRHGIYPVYEKFSFKDINAAITKQRNREIKYRVILEA